MDFPIRFENMVDIRFSLENEMLDRNELAVLAENIKIARDAIVFMTALAGARNLGGHTGGAYDIVPELLITDLFTRGDKPVYPVLFDEAGHRVAAHYVLAVIRGYMTADMLLQYREFGGNLYGHPERDDGRGIFFSSGRLGHLWSHVNGVAIANPGMPVVLFGSDGSQQEGNCAEAARFAVSNNVNLKLFIDDNDVTISGHTSKYMRGFSIGKTLGGHGIPVESVDGENFGELYTAIRNAILRDGPVALVITRPMAPGIASIEGSPGGHDAIPVDRAVDYLEKRGHIDAVRILGETVRDHTMPRDPESNAIRSKNRDDFGKYVCTKLKGMDSPERKCLVIDSDLEGSCGLHHIGREFPGLYYHAGIMERNNFSVAAGFGSTDGRQGIFGTFSAFLEMVVSEITMARLNKANVLAHFSHAGVDEMADNTCHFGVNVFFADNGLSDDERSLLIFPADTNQMRAAIDAVFDEGGLRFLFSTRSATPLIENDDGTPLYGDGYRFVPGADEIIIPSEGGYVVSYGEMLHRSLEVVRRLRGEGIDIGLVNKPTLNVIDEKMMSHLIERKFILVVEGQNEKTGLGVRFGTWLLCRGYTGAYRFKGVKKKGRGGLHEQIENQGLGPDEIYTFIANEGMSV